jgi:hypothetical protein
VAFGNHFQGPVQFQPVVRTALALARPALQVAAHEPDQALARQAGDFFQAVQQQSAPGPVGCLVALLHQAQVLAAFGKRHFLVGGHRPSVTFSFEGTIAAR